MPNHFRTCFNIYGIIIAAIGESQAAAIITESGNPAANMIPVRNGNPKIIKKNAEADKTK